MLSNMIKSLFLMKGSFQFFYKSVLHIGGDGGGGSSKIYSKK